MALKIRLRRMGRKDAPTYRVVVAESSMPRDGRFVESLGHYNPRTEPITLVIDRDRALQWLAKGAVPTDTARSLLKKAGVFAPAPAEEAAGVVATAVGAVKGAAGSVKSAAGGVVEAIRHAVEEVRERVTGEDEAEVGSAAEAGTETPAEGGTEGEGGTAEPRA